MTVDAYHRDGECTIEQLVELPLPRDPHAKSESTLRRCTGAVRVNRMRGEMLLAKARDELVTKELVERQAAYLLVALRQRILSLPQTYARRLLNISDQKEMAAKLKEMALSVLNEIKDLPSRVSDPDWLSKLEEDA